MLAGKGFKKVYNLSGGIKAWENEMAVGPEDLGLELFSGRESAEETIVAGYGLEEGLRDFYLQMQAKVSSAKAKELFGKLADIEVIHQRHLLDLYQQISGQAISREEFAAQIVTPFMEGGMTTKEYLNLYSPNVEAEIEIISLALAIEAQALDLYQRAAERAGNAEVKNVLGQIAREERGHIERLSTLIDEMM